MVSKMQKLQTPITILPAIFIMNGIGYLSFICASAHQKCARNGEVEKTFPSCRECLLSKRVRKQVFLGTLCKTLHRLFGSAANCSGAVSVPINIFCKHDPVSENLLS